MGLIVEDDSITTKKGQKGVYVKTSTGKYSFVPIQIIDDNGTNCVVKDTYFYDSDGNMTVGESIKVIGDFFRITYIRNSGAAFSILEGQRFLLLLIPVIVIVAVIWYLQKHKGIQTGVLICATMIISGGIGNLIDRVLFGEVTDMLDFSIFPPVFNIADICVTVGCFLLVIIVIFSGGSLEKQNKK